MLRKEAEDGAERSSLGREARRGPGDAPWQWKGPQLWDPGPGPGDAREAAWAPGGQVLPSSGGAAGNKAGAGVEGRGGPSLRSPELPDRTEMGRRVRTSAGGDMSGAV